MKAHTRYLWFNTKKKREFINITAELEKALETAKIQEGLVLASAMHITAGVYINDAEGGLIAPISRSGWNSLRRSVPITATTRLEKPTATPT